MTAALASAMSSPSAPIRNPREREYAWLMRTLGFGYLAGAIATFFFPEALFYVLNWGPKFLSAVEIIPNPSERFWLASACASSLTVTLLFFFAGGYPKLHSFPILIMMSRVFSAASFAYLFFYDHRYFAYVVAFGTDSLVFGIVLIAWIWVITGKSPKPELFDSNSYPRNGQPRGPSNVSSGAGTHLP